MAEFGLLAAMDGVGFLIFFLVAFISWLVNFLGSKPGGNPNRPRPAAGQGRGKQLQSEIDRFLEQARELAEKKNQKPERRGDEEVVVVKLPPDSSRRAPPPSQQRKRMNPQPAKQQQQPAPRKSLSQSRESVFKEQTRQSGNESRRQKGSRGTAGQQPRPVVAISQGAEASAQQAPPAIQYLSGNGSFASAIQGDLHAPLSQSSAAERQNESLSHRLSVAEQIALKMRSANHVRDAFVMNEVLQRALGLRRKS